jgi:hypothetical protein
MACNTVFRGVDLINPQEDRVMMRNLMLMMEDLMHKCLFLPVQYIRTFEQANTVTQSMGLAVGHVKTDQS